MKRLFINTTLLLSLSVLVCSCIRDEALGTECDITGVDETWLASLPNNFLIGTPVVRNSSVTFMVSEEADLTALAPQFEITPGASLFFIEEDGTATAYNVARLIDFTLSQTYRVVSEDGAWQKDYEVSFERPRPLDFCDFEAFTYNDANQYQRLLWQQTDGSFNATLWDSGNAGYSFTGQAASPLDYPTTFVNDEGGLEGYYARLRTLSTGVFGSLVGMPIAAGNLFLGEFQVTNAVADPLHATRFGMPILRDEPTAIEGDYRYQPAATMTGGEAGATDACDIYAVIFEINPREFAPLFGDDVKTNERIVAIAQLPDGQAQPEWTHFRLPFVYKDGRTFDEQKRRRGEYALTIVMTSSERGAYFQGAVGSTLCVDNLKIDWRNE